ARHRVTLEGADGAGEVGPADTPSALVESGQPIRGRAYGTSPRSTMLVAGRKALEGTESRRGRGGSGFTPRGWAAAARAAGGGPVGAGGGPRDLRRPGAPGAPRHCASALPRSRPRDRAASVVVAATAPQGVVCRRQNPGRVECAGATSGTVPGLPQAPGILGALAGFPVRRGWRGAPGPTRAPPEAPQGIVGAG